MVKIELVSQILTFCHKSFALERDMPKRQTTMRPARILKPNNQGNLNSHVKTASDY